MIAYEEMSMKNLLELHNKLCPDNPANPKTFATKDKLIARIERIKATSIILVDSSIDGEFRILGHKKKTEATEEHIEQRLEVVEDEPATPETPKKAAKKTKETNGKTLAEPEPKGPTIKSVAEKLILDPADYPCKVIVKRVATS